MQDMVKAIGGSLKGDCRAEEAVARVGLDAGERIPDLLATALSFLDPERGDLMCSPTVEQPDGSCCQCFDASGRVKEDFMWAKRIYSEVAVLLASSCQRRVGDCWGAEIVKS